MTTHDFCSILLCTCARNCKISAWSWSKFSGQILTSSPVLYGIHRNKGKYSRKSTAFTVVSLILEPPMSNQSSSSYV